VLRTASRQEQRQDVGGPILFSIGTTLCQFESAPRMSDGLFVSSTRKRPFRGTLPIAERAIRKVGCSEVMSDQFGLPLDDLRIVLLQRAAMRAW
jgi:hypothetical protein